MVRWYADGEWVCGLCRGYNLSPVPAVLDFTRSNAISFRNCSFRSLGASALAFGAGSQHCSVSGSSFVDVSGAAGKPSQQCST